MVNFMIEELRQRNQEIIDAISDMPSFSEKDLLMYRRNGRKIGSFLCAVLRHNPNIIGVKMDVNGAWVYVDELIKKFNDHNLKKGLYINLPILMRIVVEDDKVRYGLQMTKNNQLKIRCNQGHSIDWIEMDYKVAIPPEILYHGTSIGFLNAILKEGLKPMRRQKVHISADYETAVNVGNRKQKHGDTIILQVHAGEFVRDGGLFYLAENEVWLADEIPAKYLSVKSWKV